MSLVFHLIHLVISILVAQTICDVNCDVLRPASFRPMGFPTHLIRERMAMVAEKEWLRSS